MADPIELIFVADDAAKTKNVRALAANTTNVPDPVLKGTEYVWVAPSDHVTMCEFFLDDGFMLKPPFHVEHGAPLDLMGGTATAAAGFDTTKYTDGTHNLAVRLTYDTGYKLSFNGSFVISNTIVVPPPPLPTPPPAPVRVLGGLKFHVPDPKATDVSVGGSAKYAKFMRGEKFHTWSSHNSGKGIDVDPMHPAFTQAMRDAHWRAATQPIADWNTTQGGSNFVSAVSGWIDNLFNASPGCCPILVDYSFYIKDPGGNPDGASNATTYPQYIVNFAKRVGYWKSQGRDCVVVLQPDNLYHIQNHAFDPAKWHFSSFAALQQAKLLQAQQAISAFATYAPQAHVYMEVGRGPGDGYNYPNAAQMASWLKKAGIAKLLRGGLAVGVSHTGTVAEFTSWAQAISVELDKSTADGAALPNVHYTIDVAQAGGDSYDDHTMSQSGWCNPAGKRVGPSSVVPAGAFPTLGDSVLDFSGISDPNCDGFFWFLDPLLSNQAYHAPKWVVDYNKAWFNTSEIPQWGYDPVLGCYNLGFRYDRAPNGGTLPRAPYS